MTLQTEIGSEIAACHIDLGYPITILYSHGNAEDMTHTVPWLTRQICPRFKCNAVCYDYSGYGSVPLVKIICVRWMKCIKQLFFLMCVVSSGVRLSTGQPSEEALYADIRCVYRWARKNLKIPPESLIIFGNSLGSTVSVYLTWKLWTGGLDVPPGATASASESAYIHVSTPVASITSNPVAAAAAAEASPSSFSVLATSPDVTTVVATDTPSDIGSSVDSLSINPSTMSSADHISVVPPYASFHEDKVLLRGLLLQAPLASVGRMIGRFQTHFSVDKFDSLARIPFVGTPTLVIHGEKVRVTSFCPFSFASC